MPKRWTTKDGEVPEVTDAMVAAMRPMQDSDPDFVAAFEKAKRKRGRPQGRTKAVVSISLDQDVLQALREGGAGWQSRVNHLLRAAIGLHP